MNSGSSPGYTTLFGNRKNKFLSFFLVRDSFPIKLTRRKVSIVFGSLIWTYTSFPLILAHQFDLCEADRIFWWSGVGKKLNRVCLKKYNVLFRSASEVFEKLMIDWRFKLLSKIEIWNVYWYVNLYNEIFHILIRILFLTFVRFEYSNSKRIRQSNP